MPWPTILIFGSPQMSTILIAGNIGNSQTQHDERKPIEPCGIEQSYQSLKDREATPDLRHSCPICGNHYQPGEDVLALGRICFTTGEESASPGPSACEPMHKIMLGHHEC